MLKHCHFSQNQTSSSFVLCDAAVEVRNDRYYCSRISTQGLQKRVIVLNSLPYYGKNIFSDDFEASKFNEICENVEAQLQFFTKANLMVEELGKNQHEDTLTERLKIYDFLYDETQSDEFLRLILKVSNYLAMDDFKKIIISKDREEILNIFKSTIEDYCVSSIFLTKISPKK